MRRQRISTFEFMVIALLAIIMLPAAAYIIQPSGSSDAAGAAMLRRATPMHGDWVSLAKDAAKDYWSHRAGSDWTDKCDPANVTIFSSAVKKREIYGQALINGCRDSRHPFLVVYPAGEDVGWIYFCSIVVHEYGHLLGFKHDRKHRTDIMYPVIGEFNLQTTVCDRYIPAVGTYLEIPRMPQQR